MFDPDAIQRLLDHGDPIPPYLVRQLLAQIAAAAPIVAAARRWADAVERCDGIVGAEERLLAVLRDHRENALQGPWEAIDT